MKKNRIYNYLKQKEDCSLKWVSKNHFKIVCFLIPSAGLLLLSQLPYFNLIIRSSLMYVIIISYGLFVFRITIKYTIVMALFILVVSALFLLLKLYIPATNLFDLTFAMILVVFIKFISSEF